MTQKLKLSSGKIVEMVTVAKGQSDDLIEKLMREAIDDFEKAASDGFKLVLTIEAERNGEDAMLTIQTKGQTTVEMKRKDSTDAEIIDWGPTLFDQAQNVGGGDSPPPRLLRAAPKLLPAPVEVEAEIVEDGNDEQEGDNNVN